MSTRNTNPKRGLPHEFPGAIDYPFDDDSPGSHQLLQSDVTSPWVTDGFQAVQLYLDPALRDEAAEYCRTLDLLCGGNRNVDSLSQAVLEYFRAQGLSASVYERPQDDLSEGVIAVAVTPG
jgi:hypothetical protein